MEDRIATRRKRPRALLLSPSRELAVQTLVRNRVTAFVASPPAALTHAAMVVPPRQGIAKALCHVCKFRVVGTFGGKRKRKQRRDLDSHVDMVIATPGRLLTYRDKGECHSAGCVHALASYVLTCKTGAGRVGCRRAVLVGCALHCGGRG